MEDRGIPIALRVFEIFCLLLVSSSLVGPKPRQSDAYADVVRSDDKPTPSGGNLLARNYQQGEKLTYRMKGINWGSRYEAQANGVVRKDSSGTFFEEFTWSDLIVNNTEIPFPSANVRQFVSLDPGYKLSIPDLSQANPNLIGPILDLLTFYADMQLAARQPGLAQAGDHVYIKHGIPNSWADGSRVLIGEDAIDFDVSLADINATERIATVIVRHVPPAQPGIKLPADWMRVPVADTPNNWVQVVKKDEGKYSVQIGKETFEVEIKVNLGTGKMISATMDNPVDVLERECADAALSSCGDANRYQIRRQIEIN